MEQRRGDDGRDTTLPVRYVRIGRGGVPLVELGDPAGRPAVLLPGLSDGLAPVTEPRTRAMLRDLPLPMEAFRCLALSHRDPIATPITTRRLAEDAAAALADVTDEPAVVVGHSLGAMVAQHLAVDAPQVVGALVLSATVGRADGQLRRVLARWEDQLRSGDAVAFARDALDTSFTGEERRRRRAALDAADVPRPTRTHVERHLALSGACATHDALDRLEAIACPTLILAGSADEVAPPRHARQLAERIPGAQLEVVDGLGHAFPEQDPERFEALVTAFLWSLPPRTTSVPT